MKLDEKVINQIVETVVQKLADQEPENTQTTDNTGAGTDAVDGVFQDMTACIQATCEAQKKLVALPLEVRRNLIASIRDTGKANADDYGSMEFEETDLGKHFCL
jgi:acyl-CoA reductase-like NAD-dependent aldehyde dehydrogenase